MMPYILTGGPGHYIPQGRESLENLVVFLLAVVMILGIILLVVGFVKLMLAYMEEDGASYQKAVMYIAGGIALLIVRTMAEVFGVAEKLFSLPDIDPIARSIIISIKCGKLI